MQATGVVQSDAAVPDLFRQVHAAGLMERRTGYYLAKIVGTLAALVAGWCGLVAVGNSWASAVVAVYLGLVFTQVVFIGHDAGHHQILRDRRSNRLIGLVVGNLATGLSFGWWVPKHGAHHAHPNTEDRDPDIGRGVIAFTTSHARDRSRVSGWIIRHQAGLFFPLLVLEGLSLHVASLRSLRERKSEQSAKVEVLLLATHVAIYLGLVMWVLSPLRALAFVAVQQAVFGLYLGCSFAPNHKGMPIVDRDSPVGFCERQILTARNVRAGRLGTFVLGGLDYQIEHHLFPTMPRPNLARARPYAMAFCAQQGLSYHETGLVGSYRQALQHLREVGSGRPSRQQVTIDSGTSHDGQRRGIAEHA